VIELQRADLQALVEHLEREHFGYNDRGAAALRAYRALEAAAAANVSAIANTPFAASGREPLDSRAIGDLELLHNPDQHEG
jgi:hypothetical protein